MRSVAIDAAELASLVSAVATKLDGAVDVDLAGLVGRVLVVISVLECSVDIDLPLLDRGIRVLGLYRCRTQQRRQHHGRRQQHRLGRISGHS